MGANASKSVESSTTPSKDEQAFYAERPVRVSRGQPNLGGDSRSSEEGGREAVTGSRMCALPIARRRGLGTTATEPCCTVVAP